MATDAELSSISRFSCLFVCTLVSESASTWSFEIGAFGNMPII